MEQGAIDFLHYLAGAIDKYPALKPFLTYPGVLDVLNQAVNNGWTPDVVQSHLEDTWYWKNSTAASRQWDALRATDPVTAKQKWDVQVSHLNEMRSKLGVNITDAQFAFMAQLAVQDGWSDDTITGAMVGINNGAHLPAGGDLGAAFTQANGLAADYGIGLSAKAKLDYAGGLLTGKYDPNGLADTFRAQAVSQYGHNKQLVDALNRGVTVKQYADPYIQLAQNEVGINPADVNFQQPKWSRFLTDTDPKTGQGMTLSDWQRTLRTDQQYGYNHSSGAADQAAQLTSALAKEFGAVG